MRGNRDLTVCSAAALVCAAIAVAVPVELIRVIAALPLALFLPGYAIVAVAFGERLPAPPLLLVVSLGASLSVLALSAILLTVLPGGIETLTWALLLVVVVLACCRGAALRRAPAAGATGRLRIPRIAYRDWALLGAAAVVAIGALVLAQTPLPAKNVTGFTALWMLPTSAAERAVEVGVVSSEQHEAEYVLRIQAKGAAPQVSRFALDPGQERTFTMAVPRAAGGASAFVSASLYQAADPDHLYRRVVSWLPRKEGLP